MHGISIIKIVEIGSILFSFLGLIGTSWVTSKKNEQYLDKIVEERLNK